MHGLFVLVLLIPVDNNVEVKPQHVVTETVTETVTAPAKKPRLKQQLLAHKKRANTTIKLHPGYKLVDVTWKGNTLWGIYREMEENEEPETHVFTFNNIGKYTVEETIREEKKILYSKRTTKPNAIAKHP